jgi:Fe-S oxidoreductase
MSHITFYVDFTAFGGKHRKIERGFPLLSDPGISGADDGMADSGRQGCHLPKRKGVFRAHNEVLSRAGFDVSVPARHLCCGRPLYDFGMIERARSYLQEVLRTLSGPIDAGVPIVVLEPSCASVFRDELRNLFPSDDRAERLRKQTFVLSEFLERQAPDYVPPRLNRKVLGHGHCHHKAIIKMTDEESLLKKMGVDVRSPDAGCCGMAGPFGYEKNKYDVSQAVGERLLLPAVRAAAPDTLIVADGFSCQAQIAHGTGRRPIHLAELIHLAAQSQGKYEA